MTHRKIIDYRYLSRVIIGQDCCVLKCLCAREKNYVACVKFQEKYDRKEEIGGDEEHSLSVRYRVHKAL